MPTPEPAPLAIHRHAPTQRTDLDPRSWVELATGFVVDAAAALDEIRALAHWRRNEILRYDRFVPEQRLAAALRPDRHPLLRQTTLHLEARYGHDFSGVAAILYRDGGDFQGLHSDREMRWLDDTLIAIVVLGERRPFVLRPRSQSAAAAAADRVPAGAGPNDLVFEPGQGDLLVMGGACQRGWLHGVPGCAAPGPRLSLTWRWTSRRGRPDTNPGYGDGRQYADRAPQRGIRSRAV